MKKYRILPSFREKNLTSNFFESIEHVAEIFKGPVFPEFWNFARRELRPLEVFYPRQSNQPPFATSLLLVHSRKRNMLRGDGTSIPAAKAVSPDGPKEIVITTTPSTKDAELLTAKIVGRRALTVLTS
jgi:hypothetical protein